MFMSTPVLPVYSIYSSEKKKAYLMKGLKGLVNEALRFSTGYIYPYKTFPVEILVGKVL